MQLLDPSDQFLFLVEVLYFVGALVTFGLAGLPATKYPKLTEKGWLQVIVGLGLVALHGLFDALDTLDLGAVENWLDLLDGLFFVAGLAFVIVGVWRTANHAQEMWRS